MRPSRFRILSALLLLLCLRGSAGAQSAKLLAKQGAGLFSQGKYAEALRRFEGAFAKDPKLTRMLVLIGAAHINLDHAEEALTSYERYEQARQPLGGEDHEYLSSLYDEAARKFVADHERDPKRGELLLWAGRARSQRGDHPEAGALYERYQREVPAPAERYKVLLVRYLREHHERSLRDHRAQLERDGGRKVLLLAMGEAQVQLGQLAEALDSFDRHRAEAKDAPAPEQERRGKGYELLIVRLEAAGELPARLLLLGRAHFGLGQLEPAGARYASYEREVREPPAGDRERLKRYREEYEARRRELAEAARAAEAQEAARRAEAQEKAAAAKRAAAREEAARREEAALRQAALLGAAPRKEERRPVYKRWWLWTAVGAGVAAAVVIPLAVTLGRGDGLPAGVEIHDVTPN